MTSILLADDHEVVRRGVRALLEAHQRFVICREAVSSGCFRLVNNDVIDLDERVPVGTRVVVQP